MQLVAVQKFVSEISMHPTVLMLGLGQRRYIYQNAYCCSFFQILEFRYSSFLNPPFSYSISRRQGECDGELSKSTHCPQSTRAMEIQQNMPIEYHRSLIRALRGGREDEPKAVRRLPLRMEERMPAAGAGTGSGRARRCGFAVWLHGLGDCGRANEFIADYFSAAAFSDTRWAFRTAPTAPVTCNRGALMPSWFDIHDAPPITSKSVRGEEDVLRAVQIVHAMIDREIAAGTDPEDVFVFGLSQGGALSIASVLMYPKTLGGCAVFSGFLPFNSSSFATRVTDDAKKTPVLWIHGVADLLIPIQEGRDGVKFLRGLGMTCEFKAYDRLGHTLAPYEVEYCERWASENILNGHGEGQKPEKGGLIPGSKFFCGVFSCFSK